MKMKKIFTGILSALTAVSVISISVSAYDINTDFKTGWSVNTIIPATEFADITEDSVITFSYTADVSLSEKEGHDYWVIKPMFNDTGWPFIADINGLQLSESGDSYVIDAEKTQVSFTLSSEATETLKISGMALMGHGITLEAMTVSDGNIDSILAAEPNYSEATESEDASDEETVPETAETAPEAEETVPVSDSESTMPVTGNSSAAGILCVMVLAASAAIASKKR